MCKHFWSFFLWKYRTTYLQYKPVHLPNLVSWPSTMCALKLSVWWWKRLCRCSRWAPELPKSDLPFGWVCLLQWTLHPCSLPVSVNCVQGIIVSVENIPFLVKRMYYFLPEINSHCIIIFFFFQTSAVTVWTTVATVAMSWAVPMKPAALTSLPAAMVLASQRLLPVMARTIAWTVQMRQRVCAPHRSPRVLPTITCAHQASALTPTRCAMDRRTVTITVMKRAVVSWEWHI